MREYWERFTVKEEGRGDLGGNARLGDPRSITPALWSYLVDRFAPRSVLDVGSGEGHAAAWFHRNGVVAHAIDGSPTNVRRSRHPAALHDLTRSAYRYPCDLVWCVEVVEHIEERYLGHLLETMANADIVAMTHALPGQRGHHHVNCQPAEYWVEKLSERGYLVDPENAVYRRLAATEFEDAYFAQTGFVFLRAGSPATSPGPADETPQPAGSE